MVASDSAHRARPSLVMPMLGLLLVACRSAGYAPCPVELRGGLPADAFARCRAVLQQQYGRLAVVDEASFLLQTPWVAVDDPVGERRASVFRDPDAPEDDLAVVVELRWVSVPAFGLPDWSPPRGDAAAERELAVVLREELTTAR